MATFTYNGVVLGAGDYSVNRSDGLYNIPIRTAADNRTDADGTVVWTQKYGGRTISLEGKIMTDSAVNYFSALNDLQLAFSILSEAKALSILRWDGETRSIDCKVVTMPVIVENGAEPTTARYRVELIAEYPFFLSNTPTVYTAVLVQGSGIPLGVPLAFPMGASSKNTTIVVNNGNIAGRASFRIYGENNCPIISNLTTGESFKIDTLIASGEYVDVYKGEKGEYVLKNGSSNYYQYFSGDIFDIQPGNNTISLSASGYSSGAKVEVTFSDTYLQL